MRRVGILGKNIPLFGVALLLLFPAMGTGFGFLVEGSAAAPSSTGIGGVNPEQPNGTPAMTERSPSPPSHVFVAADGAGVSVRDGPTNRSTVLDGGVGFWTSTTVAEGDRNTTFRIRVDLTNRANSSRNVRLTLNVEDPLTVEVRDAPSGVVKVNQRLDENTWLLHVDGALGPNAEVTKEEITTTNGSSYTTREVVSDRNGDGEITTADFDFLNSDGTDGANGIAGVTVNDNGTVTLFLEGTTDGDTEFDRISYETGGFLVLEVRVPADAPLDSYTIQGRLEAASN